MATVNAPPVSMKALQAPTLTPLHANDSSTSHSANENGKVNAKNSRVQNDEQTKESTSQMDNSTAVATEQSKSLQGVSALPSVFGLAELEADAKDVQSVQERTLRDILKLHENTEYLRKYGIDGSTSVETFRKRHPLTKYDHYAEYIEREVQQEGIKTGKQILCAEPLTGFMLSSGSSQGTQKKIPRTTGWAKRAFATMGMFNEVNERNFGDRSKEIFLTFVHAGKELSLPGGLKAASGTTLGIRQMLRNLAKAKEFADKSTSPPEVFGNTDGTQAMYCHLLCALAERARVRALRANFLIHVVSGIQFLEKHWQSFVEDLRHGTVSPAMVTDSELWSAVQKRVPPQPENASALEAEFRRGFDEIVPRVFPECEFVQAVCTGAMLQYVPVMEKYAGKGVHMVSPLYMASEAPIGFALDLKAHPKDVAYTMIPEYTFWEFIPVDEPQDNEPKTKLLHELEEGRSYEVVLTNMSGLYRYRLEDVVKVTGFWHELAQVQYEYRRGTLSISAQAEKVTEKDLATAIGRTEKALPKDSGKVVDYTVAIDMKADPVRYTVFFETEGNEDLVTEEILNKCADAFEESMQETNPDWMYYRGRSNIGKAEIALVKRGTFEDLKNLKLRLGTDVAQYKPPRCLKTPEQRAIFVEGLLRSSAKECNWSKGN